MSTGRDGKGGSCFGCVVWLISFAVLFLCFFGLKACIFDKRAQADSANSGTVSSSISSTSSSNASGNTGSGRSGASSLGDASSGTSGASSTAGDTTTTSGAGSSEAKVPAEEGESAEYELKVGTPDLFGGVPEHASFEIGATLGCLP